MLWSVLSLIALLGGIGLLLAAFGRWNFLGWRGREEQRISFRPPDEVMLTPAQRACAWFFLVMAVLFLMQTLLRGAVQSHLHFHGLRVSTSGQRQHLPALLQHPQPASHRLQDGSARKRISIGIEDEADLREDLAHALAIG
jgi:hypothetical protein